MPKTDRALIVLNVILAIALVVLQFVPPKCGGDPEAPAPVVEPPVSP